MESACEDLSSALLSGEEPAYEWLYDCFHSNNSQLQLFVLSFVPTLFRVLAPGPYDAAKNLAGSLAVSMQQAWSLRNVKDKSAAYVHLPSPSMYDSHLIFIWFETGVLMCIM